MAEPLTPNMPSITTLIARAQNYPAVEKNYRSPEILVALVQANNNHSHQHPTEIEMKYLSNEWEYQDEHHKGPLPQPIAENCELLSGVTELFIAGGGGAGRALPSALKEAAAFGLNLDKLKVVCAASVGAIVALGVVIGIPAHRMGAVLNDMPTDSFQDWNMYSFINFFTRWGWCQGEAMPNYFKEMIKNETGLDDPTFIELYEAGYTKELRVITANISKQRAAIFSHIKTPHEKVAKIIGLACSIPLLFPPQWFKNEKGEYEAYADGGIAKNFPLGVGSSSSVPLSEQLGFIIINKNGADKDPNKDKIVSFWHYLRGLLTLLFTQDPLCLAANLKERTIPITVDHNPLNFSASKEQQAALDEAGRVGVRRFARHLLKNKQQHTANSTLLPLFKSQLDKNKLIDKNINSPERVRKSRFLI